MKTDLEYMRFALQLARMAEGQTSPNPCVGAVLAKDGEVVGLGAHLRAGEPHAEVHALRMAGEKARGATAYVTLEPCCHYGRTPPCADALIEAGIRRVVIATLDPNPLVAGQGAEKLRKAGIQVEVGLLEEEAKAINLPFFTRVRNRKPWTLLKSAITLDGKIATGSGDSRWISGAASREDVHRIRSRVDAIMTGVDTVIRDNPRLTVRLPGYEGRNPVRIVLDSKLRIPPGSSLLRDGAAPTWIFAAKDADPDRRRELSALPQVEILCVDSSPEGGVDLSQVFQILYEREIMTLMVEGGAKLAASLLKGGWVDQILLYVAPKILGETAKSFVGDLQIEWMKDALEFRIERVEQVEGDLKLVLSK